MDDKHDSGGSAGTQDLVSSTYIKPQARRPHDPDVTFEEYHYYALKTREEEKTLESPKLNWREVVLRKKKAGDHEPSEPTVAEEKLGSQSNRLEISDKEWTDASRAFRTASWGACK